MPPNLQNGQFSSNDNLFGDVASYTCDGGYRMFGETSTRNCLAIGHWSEIDIVCVCKFTMTHVHM